MTKRICDNEFIEGDVVTFNGKPAVFISRTVKHREIEQNGKRRFVAAFRVTRAPIVDEHGHEHAACGFCNADCSTHPDAGNPLSRCGDCGAVTCPDHRVTDDAERCVTCASVFYANGAN